MPFALELPASYLLEVLCGLELRIEECEINLNAARTARGKSEWEYQLSCARKALEHVEQTSVAQARTAASTNPVG